MEKIVIRKIKSSDDASLAQVIKDSFIDYHAQQEGTVFSDSILEKLSESFTKSRSRYFILDRDGEVLGGAGIGPLKNGSVGVCELQKMYLKKELRGLGFGKKLLDHCLKFAKEQHFDLCYLESLPELKDALKMYERNGFQYITKRLGDTGYYGCSIFMSRVI